MNLGSPCCLWGRLQAARPWSSPQSLACCIFCAPGSWVAMDAPHSHQSSLPPPPAPFCLALLACSLGKKRYVESYLVSWPVGNPAGPWRSALGWGVAGQGEEEKNVTRGFHSG